MNESCCFKCWNEFCEKNHKQNPLMLYSRMILCVLCGNKRCPHATDHDLKCSNSNEPGQEGSSYQ
jgi:hypothetical protein